MGSRFGTARHPGVRDAVGGIALTWIRPRVASSPRCSEHSSASCDGRGRGRRTIEALMPFIAAFGVAVITALLVKYDVT